VCELEKIKDNELASITHQLSEIESGKNKKLTVSMRTMLEASVQEIQQEFGQRIEGESNLLMSEILDQAVRIRNYCDVSCAVIKGDYQKELTVLAQRTDKNLADRQKKLDRSLRAMGKKYTGSQKELNNALQGLEENIAYKGCCG
jgi:vacuolar-type H+-ATPase subunit C/Vma6